MKWIVNMLLSQSEVVKPCEKIGKRCFQWGGDEKAVRSFWHRRLGKRGLLDGDVLFGMLSIL